MDYRKIDAALATALKDSKDIEERALVVFIHTEHAPNEAEVAFLEKIGSNVGSRGGQVFTATLSAKDVDKLSDQPWVRYIKLSRKVHLLNKIL
jgi:hypothetical protein